MVNRRTRLLTLATVLMLSLSACAKQKSVEEYLQDGQQHLESGDLSKAIAALEEARNRDPNLAEAHRLLGEAFGRSGRWPEAVIELEAYRTLASQDAAAYFMLGQAYVQTDDLKKAASTFAEGVRIDPSFLDSRRDEVAEVANGILQAGQEALDDGDLATATELLTIVAPLVAEQSEVYVALGRAHLQANDTVQALSAFAYATTLSPAVATEYADEIAALAQAGLELGQAALDDGDLDTAAQIMQAVTVLLPGEAKTHFVLGNVYNQANQLAQASEQYQAVLSLEPDSAAAHTNLGVVHYKMGELEAALREYEAALQIEPDDAETHYLLGAAYVQMEQLEQGRVEFEAALALDDQLAEAYIGLGNVYLLRGELEAALAVLEQAAALAPNSPEAYFALGQVHVQLNNTAEARAALERVLSLNPAPRWREQVELMLEGLESE